MNSYDLRKYRFKKWHKLGINEKENILNILPIVKGVYVIKYKKNFGRFKSKSDIFYIGSSMKKNGGLKSRIKSYFKPGPTQGTSQRINDLLIKTDDLKIAFVKSLKAKNLEKEIRSRYEEDHGEFPPLNRSA